MSFAETAFKGLVVEIVGGVVVIVWIFTGVAVIVGICNVVAYVKEVSRGSR